MKCSYFSPPGQLALMFNFGESTLQIVETWEQTPEDQISVALPLMPGFRTLTYAGLYQDTKSREWILLK